MHWLVFLHQFFSELWFSLQSLIKIVKLVLDAVGIDGLSKFFRIIKIRKSLVEAAGYQDAAIDRWSCDTNFRGQRVRKQPLPQWRNLHRLNQQVWVQVS